ncbi:MAG: hypothetical protein J6K86_00280, partial [Clostridia bacterium]|nr:hypothetical protein [Clostridia bacterium]
TSSFTPDIEIPVYRVTNTRSGSGVEAGTPKICKNEGIYRAELKSADQCVFYRFEPTENGVYTIESWVDTNEGRINPRIDVYAANAGGFTNYLYTLDEGGNSKGFTRNFKYTIEWDESNVGGIVVFGIRAEVKNDVYPVNVEFALMRDGSFTAERNQAEWKLPAELYGLMGAYMLELQAMDEQTFLQTTIDIVYNNISTALAPSEIRKELAEEYVVLQQLTPEDYSSPDAIQNALEYKIEDCDLTYDEKGEPVREIDCYIRTYLVAKVREKFDSLKKHSGTLVGAEQYYTPEGSSASILAFRGENYRLSPKTGVYHLYDETKYASDPYEFGAGFGPVLYGKITSPIRFIGDGGEALTNIEAHGNKALTVSNGTENYKLFIEGYNRMYAFANSAMDGSGQLNGMPDGFPDLYKNALGYADFVNGDGLVPVTPELKEFFQKFSVNQRLFNDGNGYAEVYATPQVDALEEDQWLFACCYYKD